jgi:gliding motility-associated-like protein
MNIRRETLPPLDIDIYANKIESPNEPGIRCGYAKSFLNVERSYKYIKYNYIRSSSYPPKENMIQAQKKPCSDAPVTFSLLFQQIDSVGWNFGDTAAENNDYSSSFKPSHTYPSPGNYNVRAIMFSQCFTDTAYSTITITDEPSVKMPTFADTTICTGSSYVVDATVPSATKYMWENGGTDPVRKIDAGGYYRLTASNNCSVDTAGFNVKVQSCDCTFFVPTAFTPNNDGLNDRFKPLTKCFPKDYQLKIFDRYGRLVYTASQLNQAWDGTIGDTPASAGTFVWILQYRDPNNNQLFKKSGTIVLIR